MSDDSLPGVSPSVREMANVASYVVESHRIGETIPTTIDGDPLSPEDADNPDYGVVACVCGWVSQPFIFKVGNEASCIHDDHVNEELRVNVYRTI